MASRWAYEGLMVKFFVDNAYEREFYAVEQKASEATYRKDYWLPKMADVTAYCERHQSDATNEGKDQYKQHLSTLQHEVADQGLRTPKIVFACRDSLEKGFFSSRIAMCLQDYYGLLQKHYVGLASVAREKHDAIDQQLAQKYGEPDGYTQFRQRQHNEAIDKLVRNADSGTRLQMLDGELVRSYEPVYNLPENVGFPGYRTHFYAASKRLMGMRVDTFTFNVAVIWLMTIFLYVCLHFELFRRMLTWLEGLRTKWK